MYEYSEINDRLNNRMHLNVNQSQGHLLHQTATICNNIKLPVSLHNSEYIPRYLDYKSNNRRCEITKINNIIYNNIYNPGSFNTLTKRKSTINTC